jgi:hypothetical protein
MFTTVGLPDSAVRESRDRVRAAIKNSGFEFPQERITVNLAPADLRKEGAAFDLPTAVGILAATGLVKPDRIDRALVLGELSLDGRVCPVRGVLPVALSCRRAGYTPLVVPADNAAEAGAVGGLRVTPVATLQDTVDFLNGEREPPSPPSNVGRWLTAPSADAVDFADVRGHAHAKRALEIAAAGAHNVMRLGPIPSRRGSTSCWRPGRDMSRLRDVGRPTSGSPTPRMRAVFARRRAGLTVTWPARRRQPPLTLSKACFAPVQRPRPTLSRPPSVSPQSGDRRPPSARFAHWWPR